MRINLKLSMMLVMVILLSGCVADQRDRRLVKPLEKMAAPYDNGTIYKAGFNERPLYEEKRARNVGDGLIMNVPEQIVAVKKDSSKDKDGEKSEEEDKVAERKRRRSEEEDLSYIATDALVGAIAMTVIDVTENGFLYVAGGKMVTVDEEDKYVRITGMVDPATITGGNTVLSTLVSDVRIQVDALRIRADRTATNLTEGETTFGNFFQSMRP